MFPTNLKPGKIHVLGGKLSRALQMLVDDVEVVIVDIKSIPSSNEDDELFGPLLKVMEGQNVRDQINQKKFESLAGMFHRDGERLLYDGKLYIPRRLVRDVMHLVHDAKVSGHLGYFKTMTRLKNVYWKHKARDEKQYVQGLAICQQKKDP